MPLNSIFLHESNRPIRPHAYDPFAQICNFLITKKLKGNQFLILKLETKNLKNIGYSFYYQLYIFIYQNAMSLKYRFFFSSEPIFFVTQDQTFFYESICNHLSIDISKVHFYEY